MKKLSTYLLTIFMVMFWVFRVVVALGNSTGNNMGFPIENITTEIILLFVDIVLILLVIKRKIIGSLGFLLVNIWYFGPKLLNALMTISSGEAADIYTIDAALEGFIALVLAIAILFDMLLDKNRVNNPKDKKTDWFYKGEQYDRQLDERADKNNYRTL